MLKIVDATENLSEFFGDGFSMEQWDRYMDTVLPLHKDLFINDMQETIRTGGVTFERDYLPVLKVALADEASREKAAASFRKVTDNLDEKVLKTMGKPVDATVILYLGLCNGAGWVVELDSRRYVLLGIEKIVELGWCGIDDMYGLIYHELGHIYHAQHGKRNCKNSDAFLWQLFAEGVAMVFEQKLVGNSDYFHQDRDGWASWCADNLRAIVNDFNSDLTGMTRENQRYFGDWVSYRGHPDVGYYLGARFVQWLNGKYRFDELLNFDIETVRAQWASYLNVSNRG